MHTVVDPRSVGDCSDQQQREESANVLFAIDTDVSLAGVLLEEWLLVTERELLVSPERFTRDYVGASGEHNNRLSLPWSEIQSVRTVSGVGSGLLQAKVSDVWLDILRFSNALALRFHKVASLLERYREEKEAARDGGKVASWPELNESDLESLDPPRCKQCSLRLGSRAESCPRCVERGQILRQVIYLLKPHTKGALFLCLLTLIGVGAELIPPKLQQYMVDHVLTGSSTVDVKTALLVVVLALAFSRVLLSVVGVIKGQISTAIGTGLTSTLRAEMVQKLQKLAIAYYDRHQVGSMLSRVAHDSEVLHGLMHQLTGGFLLQTAQLIGVGAMLVWLNPKLALFTLIPVPLVILGSWFFWQRVYPRYYRLWDASSRQMSVLGAMLSGIRVVKAFAQEDREYDRFNKASEHLKQWRLWVENTNAYYSAAMSVVFSLGGLIVWYVGGRDVIGKEMTLGELIAFFAYLAMFYAPLSALSNFTSWLTSFLSGSKRVLELLDTPIAIQEPEKPEEWTEPLGKIEFDHVTFGYDRNQPVLKDVCFEVAAGEMVGIVGRSGSGKTTLVNLLGRFYDVQEGRILVDGIDIRSLKMQQLRERLGIVFQDSFLFRGTIWKNLSYGRPSTTIEEGLVAAKAAGAHDFILRQPLAYETFLGEHGAGLSGGEKQRLSIARTLLYDPKILVLDEATSNIDAEAEKSIQEALEVLIKGRTTVAIAHRLSTLRNADRIIVFDRGRLIENGTHTELLEQNGTYARLVRLQTQVTKDPSIDHLLVNEPGANNSSQTLDISDQHALDLSKIDSTAASKSIAKSPNPKPKNQNQDSPSPSPSENKENKENKDSPASMKSPKQDSPVSSINWLCPKRVEFRKTSDGRTELWIDGECVGKSVLVLAAFPASQADRYLSIRQWQDHGEDSELGMISELSEWPMDQQEIIRSSRDRHYLLRKIERVYQSRLKLGFLEMDVETNLGREKVNMRWTQSQAIDFGERGKMILATEENRYIVPDTDALPKLDRERFTQYIYW
jgi:ATP-binding cassette subfamily B protein